jgi:glycosyltransferase involved in cell wall biosynthesis
MADTVSPKVTIGLPVYNGERHLRAAIESVLGQTYTDLELVVSDNASTDATPDICRGYARRDPRVRYERLPSNLGARRNFVIVLERARGEYFKWSGHDDVLAPDFLGRCVKGLDDDPGAVVYGTDIEVIDDVGARVGPGPRPIAVGASTPHGRLREFFDHPRAHQTIFGLIRRSALEATTLFGPWFGSDRALLMELALLGRFGRADETLFFHREHPGRSDYVESKVDWYTPERGARPAADHWRHLGKATRMLMTMPMPPLERARCLAECGRRGRMQLREWAPLLWREAAATVRSVAVGPRRR